LTTENLSELIKDTSIKQKSKPKEDLTPPEPELPKEEQIRLEEEVRQLGFDLRTVPIVDWIEKYKTEIAPKVKPVKMVIDKVNSKNTLCVSVEKNETTRELFLFRNASHVPILDNKPMYFDVFNDGIYTVTMDTEVQGLFLKVYRVKTGLIISYCLNIEDRLIPYYQARIKNRDKGIKYIHTDPARITQELEKPVDIEGIQILYRQLMKADVSKIKTKKDLFDWFAERIKITRDTNHLVMIDSVIIFMLTKQ
jgi:hypothetical protein